MEGITINFVLTFFIIFVANLIVQSSPHGQLNKKDWNNLSITQFDHKIYKDSLKFLKGRQHINTPMYRVLRPGSLTYHSYPIIPQFSTANIFHAQLLGFASINIPQILQLIGCTKFLEIVQRANLKAYLESMGPFTVFAPDNDAFKDVNITNFDEDDLYNLVLLHVVPKKLRLLEVIFSGKQALKTQSEQTLEIYQTSDGFTVGGASLLIHYSDNVANNGVVHVIKHIAIPTEINQKISQEIFEMQSTMDE